MIANIRYLMKEALLPNVWANVVSLVDNPHPELRCWRIFVDGAVSRMTSLVRRRRRAVCEGRGGAAKSKRW